MEKELVYNHVSKDVLKKIPKKVNIWDETLRDGEQSPGVFFNKDEKVTITKKLAEAGTYMIGIGFPGVSKGEDYSIRSILKENLPCLTGVTVRTDINDVDRAIDLGVKRVHAFVSTSPLHMKYKLNKSPEEVEAMVEKSITYAKDHGLTVDFIAEDTSRSDLDYVSNLFNLASECGAEILMITDTVGCATPSTIKYICNYIQKNVKNKKFGIHCHNDLGLANANTISAIEEGIEYPTLTVNGIGERSGNASFAEIVMTLENIYGIDTGIKKDKIKELSDLVEETSGIFLPVHQPIVGFNSFRHESGIHVNGLLKKLSTYEIMDPNDLGTNREFVLGKHSGKSLIKNLLDKRGLKYTPEQLEKIVDRVADEKEKTASEKEARSRRLKHEIKDFNKDILGFSEDKFWRIAYSVTGGWDGENGN